MNRTPTTETLAGCALAGAIILLGLFILFLIVRSMA